jgi:hypothetical protein
MNSLTKNIIYLILVSGFVVVSNSQTCKATLTIETDGEVAGIYLNQKLLGTGKAKVELEPGTYEVMAKENVKDWKTLVKTVGLNECDSLKISFKFNEEKYLQTNPQDVAVYNGDSLIGYTPLYLTSDYKSLELNKLGYESKTISSDNISSNQPVALNYIGEVKGKSFYKKDLFKYLVAGIVVLGGTSAYFKLKADKKFDTYKITGEQGLLDQTHKYDLISGITFTALQINFGTLIYLFLSD